MIQKADKDSWIWYFCNSYREFCHMSGFQTFYPLPLEFSVGKDLDCLILLVSFLVSYFMETLAENTFQMSEDQRKVTNFLNFDRC